MCKRTAVTRGSKGTRALITNRLNLYADDVSLYLSNPLNVSNVNTIIFVIKSALWNMQMMNRYFFSSLVSLAGHVMPSNHSVYFSQIIKNVIFQQSCLYRIWHKSPMRSKIVATDKKSDKHERPAAMIYH